MISVTWVLIANRRRASVLQASLGEFALIHTLENPAADETPEPGQEPGRMNLRGGARTAFEPHEDPAHAVCRQFAAEIVQYLESRRHHGSFNELVIVAPPKFLGAIRDRYSPALHRMVTHEVDQDYTEIKPPALHERLQAILTAPVGGE